MHHFLYFLISYFSFQVQGVPHAVFLGFQIPQVIGIGSDFDGNVLHDFQSVGLQTDTLDGIVGQQAHLMDTQVSQHLGTTSVVTLVGLEAEVYVGIYGVESFFLQLLGGNLVHQADAPAFLLHVDDDTFSLFLDGLHRLVKLFTAVTPLGSKDVAGHTGGMDTH